jgi:hypothetical protein
MWTEKDFAMSTKDIFIPKENSIQAPGNDFHWNLGADPVYAGRTAFYYSLFEPIGEESWSSPALLARAMKRTSSAFC